MGVGRKAVPTETKKLTGNPGKRAMGESDPSLIQYDECPEPPEWLGPIGLKEWRRVGPYLVKMKLLTHNDYLVFAAYCANVEQMVTAIEDLEKRGYEVEGQRGPTRNPAVTVFTSSVTALRSLAAEFGMTPSSRARIKLPGDDGESLEDLLRDEGGEDAS